MGEDVSLQPSCPPPVPQRRPSVLAFLCRLHVRAKQPDAAIRRLDAALEALGPQACGKGGRKGKG